MTDALELKPCPFCRFCAATPTDDGEFATGEAPGRFAVKCPDCRAIGPFRWTKALAIDAWNAAADHTPADAVEALEAAKAEAFAAGQKAVKVKPLVWEQSSETTRRSQGYVLRETHVGQFMLSFLDEIIGEYSGGAALRFAIKAANEHNRARITALEAELDEWMKVVGQIAEAVPLPRVVSVTGSVGDLIDYFKGLQAERDRLREALEDLRKSAALLQQNAEGCAVNHYGEDFSIHGLPGWLVDTRASIERAALAGGEP